MKFRTTIRSIDSLYLHANITFCSYGTLQALTHQGSCSSISNPSLKSVTTVLHTADTINDISTSENGSLHVSAPSHRTNSVSNNGIPTITPPSSQETTTIRRLFHASTNYKSRKSIRIPTFLPSPAFSPRYVDWDLVIIHHACNRTTLWSFILWIHLHIDIREYFGGLATPVKRPRVPRKELCRRAYANTLATRLSSGIWWVEGDASGGIKETIIDELNRKLGGMRKRWEC